MGLNVLVECLVECFGTRIALFILLFCYFVIL